LSAEINAAFGFVVNPDSALDLRAAFRRAGFDIDSTRSWVIKELTHPAVTPVLAYKELSRVHTANGWNWLDEWAPRGRFRPEYLPGSVVSGRWATRGGGALQIPRALRKAVVADPGHCLVVADAAQLEPRVLAAVSSDTALQGISADEDLYTALANDGFGGDRAHAKVAMLGAMYGATTGEAGRLLGTLRERYPVAMGYVEDAARRGERGDVVHSVLGRACPPPSDNWRTPPRGSAHQGSRKIHPQLRGPGVRGGLGLRVAFRVAARSGRHPGCRAGLLPTRRAHRPGSGGKLRPGR
jgi:DNA polymerase-1